MTMSGTLNLMRNTLYYLFLFIYFNLQKWRNAFTKHIHTGKISQVHVLQESQILHS
jgi:hypothetical protein